MFKIGDFSKLSRVPVKTLRYYDEIGLLKPVAVDRYTRYRYYSIDQLPTLYRILGMKELGFSLEQIGQLLTGELTPQQIKKMLEVRQSQIERQIEQELLTVQRIQVRLKEIELEGKLADYEIILKQVEPAWVASRRGVITSYDESGPIFDSLFDEVYAYVHRQGVRNPGCGIAVYHDAQDSEDDRIQVEALAQLPGQIRRSQRVRVYELPELETAASVVHHGPFTTIGNAYQAVLTWIQSNGYRIAGPTRELYLSYQRGGDQNRYVTEIQFPVNRIEERKMKAAKIVQLDKILMVGMPYLGDNENNEIAQLWQEFVPRIPQIRHIAPGPDISYGVCSPHLSGLIDYTAALEVTSLEDIPEGMVGLEVPAQTYVVFPAHGIPDISPTYQMILEEWLPGSGYKPVDGSDFEYYPETFDPGDPESVVYIYFPIQKA
jgi:predicted transcriptional regulator YdeE/DNA-binding transcriptional MerR regulator